MIAVPVVIHLQSSKVHARSAGGPEIHRTISTFSYENGIRSRVAPSPRGAMIAGAIVGERRHLMTTTIQLAETKEEKLSPLDDARLVPAPMGDLRTASLP
jgi:hypothetical protein